MTSVSIDVIGQFWQQKDNWLGLSESPRKKTLVSVLHQKVIPWDPVAIVDGCMTRTHIGHGMDTHFNFCVIVICI